MTFLKAFCDRYFNYRDRGFFYSRVYYWCSFRVCFKSNGILTWRKMSLSLTRSRKKGSFFSRGYIPKNGYFTISQN